LRECREVWDRLRRVQEELSHGVSPAVAPLPFNLGILLAQFDRYIKWVARNVNVLEIPPTTPYRASGDGDSA
jgi:hypothetical protein